MSDLTLPILCGQFEAQVSDYIDGALSVSARTAMDTHSSACASCQLVLADLREIVIGAAALPLRSPSRDLWSGIAQRLDTPVVSINAVGARPRQGGRTMSFRVFAAAAALLVTVSSGATYLLTRPGTPASGTFASSLPVQTPSAITSRPLTDTTPLPPAAVVGSGMVKTSTGAGASSEESPAELPNERNVAVLGRPRARYAASSSNSVEFVYEREITAMRRIVDERLGDLDSVTVVEIERNLRIIDRAISDSRKALQTDPRSRFLSTQLDRALENKLDIMRRIALL